MPLHEYKIIVATVIMRFFTKKWRLEGWDTFAGHSYPIPGLYPSESKAIDAARRQLAQIEKEQPTELSGGQSGIQDHVYVVGPSGERKRIEA